MLRGANIILDGIDFSVEDQEKIAILGPNGAGKTSLLNVLSGHYSAGGQVTLDDRSLSEWRQKDIAGQIAVVHQQTPNYQHYRVVDVIRLGLLPQKQYRFWDNLDDKERVQQALRHFNLVELQYREMASLSGGEKQRVQLARALVQNTEIILLDEPTSHLDVYYQHEILSYVSQLEKTVIVTLHDINLALRYCSRLLLIDKGRLIFDGTANELPESKALEKVYRLPLRFWRGAGNDPSGHESTKSNTLQVEFLRDDS